MKVTIAALGLSALVGCSTVDNLRKDTIKAEGGRNVLICKAGERIDVKYDPFDANETVVIRIYGHEKNQDIYKIMPISGREYERYCAQIRGLEGCAERSKEVSMVASLAYSLSDSNLPDACDPLLRALYLK